MGREEVVSFLAWARRANRWVLSAAKPRRARIPQHSGVGYLDAKQVEVSSYHLGCDGEVAEIGSLFRAALGPEDEQPASVLGGVRTMRLAGLEMQRSAGLVLLALVDEVALNNIKRLGHAFVEMCRNDRVGFQADVHYDRPQRVIRIANAQGDVALTGEGETIGLELTVEYFLIDHDAGSLLSTPADLISAAARSFTGA